VSVSIILDCRRPQDEFSCVAGGCIPKILECDGKKDCVDGSDEAFANCGQYHFFIPYYVINSLMVYVP